MHAKIFHDHNSQYFQMQSNSEKMLGTELQTKKIEKFKKSIKCINGR